MHSSTSVSSFIALFSVMLVLAAVPSTSVLIVVTRSAASGFKHGFFAALGIVVGDIIFILIAILGLSLLAETMGELFVWVKYMGAAYLVWMGIGLWRAKPDLKNNTRPAGTSLLTSFMSGLLFTLADQKAILFYLGFFPAFLDLSTLTSLDIGIIILITLFAVGGVKIVYAFLADQAIEEFSDKLSRGLGYVAASVMITTGLYIVLSENIPG